jgi:hypothetical protein
MLLRFYTPLIDVTEDAPGGHLISSIFDWRDFLIGFVLVNLSKV